MGVGIKVGSIIDELGTASFIHAFFSTVAAHCEPRGWGTEFPALTKHLYGGALPASLAATAREDLRKVKMLLGALPPSKVVWDYSDRSLLPPWGSNISESITSLGNYFVTSTGKDLIGVLEEALTDAVDSECGASLEKTPEWSGRPTS